jgi:hypothetical protein
VQRDNQLDLRRKEEEVVTEELPARPSMADEQGGQREREREGEIGERERSAWAVVVSRWQDTA